MTSASRKMLIGLVGSSLALLSWTVWPTRYRYDHSTFFDQPVLVRIDRISGETSYFFMGNWIRESSSTHLAEKEVSAPKLQEIPNEERAKIQCSGEVEATGWFEGKLYNGSTWTIEAVEITLSDLSTIERVRWSLRKDSLDDQPNLFAEAILGSNDRTFRETCVHIPPLSSGKVIINVGWHQRNWFVSKYFGTRSLPE